MDAICRSVQPPGCHSSRYPPGLHNIIYCEVYFEICPGTLATRTQQTVMAIPQNAPPTEIATKGSKGVHELLQSNTSHARSSTDSGGDSVTHRTTNCNNLSTNTRTDSPTTEDQDSAKHIHQEVPKSSNGTTSQPSKRRDISLNRGGNGCQQLHEGSLSGTDPERTQSSTNQRTSKNATREPNKGHNADIQHKEASTTTRATQVYLKKREAGTQPPFVLDNEEAELLLFNFVQSIVQQTQQHMFKQLEQCMQQAYSGLFLGTPVRAKEYMEQFKKNNNTVLLTKTK